MVEVLEYGTRKYSSENWKKGLDQRELMESMIRHMVELNKAIVEKREDLEYDLESTLHHIGHIMCNCMFYAYHKKNNSFKNKT